MKHSTIRWNGTGPLIVWQSVYWQTELVRRNHRKQLVLIEIVLLLRSRLTLLALLTFHCRSGRVRSKLGNGHKGVARCL